MFQSLGLPINQYRNVQREIVIEDIREFISSTNCTSSSIYRKQSIYKDGIIARCGGWENILHELGLTSTRNSQGECLIEKYLINNNMKYEIHKTFPWLINSTGTKLFVDFYLVDYNVVIEYDGEQHYKFVPYFHKTIENFNKCVERDRIKESILKDNNIKLFRIKYNDNILSKTQEVLKSLV